MLTAVLQDGTRISMADKWFESELMDLRKKQQFKCPVCNAGVTLKLGSKRQWHFAHQTKHTCRISLEPESPYHLKGKLDIYHWLINQGIKASLEMYLPLIQQRPDVLCKVEGKLYAIEYQCSPLSEELFFERTMGYRRMGITPIWILGGNRLRRKQAEQYHLLGFEWNTSRLNRLEQMYVTYYCSETQLWAFLFELQSYSTNGALARLSYKRQNTLSIEDLLYPRDIAPYQYKSWLNIKKSWRYQGFQSYPSKSQIRFSKWLYQKKIPLGQFPAEAGWFLSIQHQIKTAPHIWQTILLIKTFHLLPLNQMIEQHVLESNITTFVMNGTIIFRNHQVLDLNELISQMVFEYCQLLLAFGMIKKLNHTDYLYIKPVSLPKSVDQANQMDQNLSNLRQNTPNILHIQR